MSQNTAAVIAAAAALVNTAAPVTAAPVTAAAASALVELIVNHHATRSGRVYAPALADDAAQAAIACVSPLNTSPDVIRTVTEAVYSTLIARVMRPGAAEAAAMSDDELIELYRDRCALYARERMRISDMLYVAGHAAEAMTDELNELVNTAKAFSSSYGDDRLRLHDELIRSLYGARVNVYYTLEAAIAPCIYDVRHVTIVERILSDYAQAMSSVLDYTPQAQASGRLFAAEAYNEADVLGYYAEKLRHAAQALDV